MQRALALCPEDGHADLVALAATLTEVPAAVLGVRLGQLGFERRERDRVAGDPAAERVAAHWLDDLRHRDTVVSGHDLEAAGLSGPAVGRGLRAARAAVLEGRAPDFERQLAAALAAGREQ